MVQVQLAKFPSCAHCTIIEKWPFIGFEIMQALRLAFNKALAGTEADVMQCPGIAGVAVLLNREFPAVTEEDIRTVFTEKSWSEEKAVSRQDILELCLTLNIETTSAAEVDDASTALGECDTGSSSEKKERCAALEHLEEVMAQRMSQKVSHSSSQRSLIM